MDTESVKELTESINNVVLAAIKPYKEQIEELRSQLIAKQSKIDGLQYSLELYRTGRQGLYVR